MPSDQDRSIAYITLRSLSPELAEGDCNPGSDIVTRFLDDFRASGHTHMYCYAREWLSATHAPNQADRSGTYVPPGPLTADERRARLTLSFLADPGDTVLGAALRTWTGAATLALVTGSASTVRGLPDPELAHAVTRWRERLRLVPSPVRLAFWHDHGLRLAMPGDPEWPPQLDDLEDARPLLLWLRGSADLRQAAANSVAIAGSHAGTQYGTTVALQMAASLTEQGVTVAADGGSGAGAAAHRGSLNAGGNTVAVLAGGLDNGHPPGHAQLFASIARQGVLASECPPDRAAARRDFLARDRLLACLTRATIIIEAPLRSGSLNVARHASELGRVVMAVPGDINSEHSAGANQLIRQHGALCVTSTADVMAGLSSGAAAPRAALDPVTAAVLEQVPASGGRGSAAIAARAGTLASAGLVERGDGGWRLPDRVPAKSPAPAGIPDQRAGHLPAAERRADQERDIVP
jgi:DNA processing protein